MKVSEFSLEFDTLYNNIMSDIAPGLNEYEKSLFLTQAQESLVISLYKGDYSSVGTGFENSEEYIEYLKNLIKEEEIEVTPTKSAIGKCYTAVLPSDVMFITWETVGTNSNTGCVWSNEDVVVANQDSINKLLRNPFRGPLSGRTLKLVKGSSVELYTDKEVSTYKVRYIKKPYPIILTDLTDLDPMLSIDGHTLPNNPVCELNEVLHRQILMNAVSIAKAVWKQ